MPSHRPSLYNPRAPTGCGGPRRVQVSKELMLSLQLEATLEGHSGCVNCLAWNRSGSLLASGSDDRDVIIWEPFKRTKRSVIHTGHEGNIFSVKFIPDLSDTLIATCANDGHVKLIDTVAKEILMNCKSCHSERVKRLVVHDQQPHLLWSAGEDGFIMQYDLRLPHICNPTKPKNLLLDLKTANTSLAAKCLAINPMRDEMLAVGSNDVFIRLFDRRFIPQMGWESCTAYFSPGHLVDQRHSNRSFGTTYLEFSPDGSELLANMHAEQIYLFNTYEPQVRYKSFEATAKPLILDLHQTTTEQPEEMKNYFRGGSKNQLAYQKRAPINTWQELRRSNKCTQLPEKHSDFYNEVRRKLKETPTSGTSSQQVTMAAKTNLGKDYFDKMNHLLVEYKHCSELYHLRASALIQRKWKGDLYQAIRDSCSALALNPLDYRSFKNLAQATMQLGMTDASEELVEIVRLLQQSSPCGQFATAVTDDGARKGHSYDEKKLQKVMQSLVSMRRNSSPNPWLEFNGDDLTDDDEEEFDNTANNVEEETTMTNGGNSSLPSFDAATLLATYASQIFCEFSDSCQEEQRSLAAFDYACRFCGHCNMNTDIKEANFFGQNGEFIVGGSDDGAFYIWDKETTNIIKAVYGDLQILNCLQPHPNICMLATSGIEPLVKLWSPSGKTCFDVKSLELRCAQNQDYITSDPLEAMIMMLYPSRDI